MIPVKIQSRPGKDGSLAMDTPVFCQRCGRRIKRQLVGGSVEICTGCRRRGNLKKG